MVADAVIVVVEVKVAMRLMVKIVDAMDVLVVLVVELVVSADVA